MTSTWGSRRSWGTKRSRRTLAGSPRRSGAGSGPPVVATTSTSSPARARVVTNRRRPRSALSSVPWVTWTTGRPAPSSGHQDGSSKDWRRRGQDRPHEAHRRGEVRTRVFESRHRLLQVGVDHLGLEVDEVAGESRRRAGLGQPTAGEALDVGQHEVLGGPVHGGVAEPVQRTRPGLEGHAERRRVPAVGRVGHDADAGQRRAGRAGAQRQGEGAEEHGVDHDAVGGEALEDGAQVAVLPRDRADEDPAQVVLHAPHAALGRRLALGVGHHQVVGVVLRREGHEAGARRLDPVAVVLGREERDVVALPDEPARQRQQRRGVALGRRGAQHEPPGHGVTGSPITHVTTAAPQGGSVSAPSTLDPSSPCRC